MRMIVIGLKGSGKTTTLKKVVEKKSNIKYVNIGDYFEKVLKKHHLTRDEAEIQMDREIHVKLQKEAFNSVMKEAKKHKHVMIDTHAILKRKEGYFQGLPDYVLRIVKPDMIVMFDYKPEFILERRLKDLKTRKRSVAMTIEGVKKEQKIQLEYANEAVRLAKCKLKIIRQDKLEKYPFEHAEKNAEEVLKLFV